MKEYIVEVPERHYASYLVEADSLLAALHLVNDRKLSPWMVEFSHQEPPGKWRVREADSTEPVLAVGEVLMLAKYHAGSSMR